MGIPFFKLHLRWSCRVPGALVVSRVRHVAYPREGTTRSERLKTWGTSYYMHVYMSLSVAYTILHLLTLWETGYAVISVNFARTYYEM